ncbi:MAG: TIR domain-containing protein [Promethearchaeota archaeon]
MNEQFVTVFGKKIYLDNKGILNLYGRKISGLDQIFGLYELGGLKGLNLTECSELVSLSDDLGKLKSLETLILKACTSLESIPENIGELQALGTLNLGRCRFSTLPEGIGNLKNLLRLNLGSCRELTMLPTSIGNLQKLKKIILHNCHVLTSLPESIGNLQELQSLDLSLCYSLTTLPESIGNLKSLQILDCSSCLSLVALPESIGNLQSLKTLELPHCESLTALPESIGNLKSLSTLNLEDSNFKEIPPMLYSLKSLSSLKLDGNPLNQEELGIAISPISVIQEYLKKKAAIRVFLSHAEADYHNKLIKIKEIAEFLEGQKEIYNAYYSEEDLQGEFDDFMRKYVPKSQILLFFATKNSLKSNPCKLELQLALDNRLQIIPILGEGLNWPDLNTIKLYEPSGDLFQLAGVKGLPYSDDFTNFSENLYDFICKLKQNIDLFDKEEALINQFQLDLVELINSYIKSQEYQNLLRNNFKEIYEFYKKFKEKTINNLEFLEIIFHKLRKTS